MLMHAACRLATAVVSTLNRLSRFIFPTIAPHPKDRTKRVSKVEGRDPTHLAEMAHDADEQLAVGVAARERLLPAVVEVDDALRVAIEHRMVNEPLDAGVHPLERLEYESATNQILHVAAVAAI